MKKVKLRTASDQAEGVLHMEINAQFPVLPKAVVERIRGRVTDLVRAELEDAVEEHLNRPEKCRKCKKLEEGIAANAELEALEELIFGKTLKEEQQPETVLNEDLAWFVPKMQAVLEHHNYETFDVPENSLNRCRGVISKRLHDLTYSNHMTTNKMMKHFVDIANFAMIAANTLAEKEGMREWRP